MNDRLENPLVSICIPMYNAEITIKKTLASIINQTYKNIEIIIVDNYSSDNSVKIVQEFNDPRIKLICYNIHVPYAELNWNRCFQYVNGEYMAIFHSDDIYLPDMVLCQIEIFEKYPIVGGVFTQGNIINGNDEVIGEFKLPSEIKGGKPYSYQELFNSLLKYADFLPTPSAMIRKDIYLKCSPFKHDQFKSASDFDMWLRISSYTSLVILNEKLMNYRVHKTQGSNIFNKLRTRESDFFEVMDNHLCQIYKNIVSIEALNSYDLSRFGDQVFCAKNSILKKDWVQFKYLLKRMRWIHFFKISITNPQLLYAKLKMFIYFKVFKV